MAGRMQPPAVEKFLPPPPDEAFGTIFRIAGDIAEAPLRVLDGVRSAAQNVINEVKSFPRRN